METNNLGELFAAMAAARLEFGALTKGKTASIRGDKASYTYSYADLSDIIEATSAALAKHGLIIIQEPEIVSDNGRQMVVINGCIAHKSGGIYPLRPLPMPIAGNTAQSIGSAISYARRYQLSAILNLAATDDDGEAASTPMHEASRQPKVAKQQPASNGQNGTTPQHRTVNASVSQKTTSGSDAPTDEELDIISGWSSPPAAQMWAVKNGYCDNEHHARESWLNSVKACGGYTDSRKAEVFLHFLRHQLEKETA